MLRPSFLPLFTECVEGTFSEVRLLDGAYGYPGVLREGPVLGPTARYHQMALPSRAVEAGARPSQGSEQRLLCLEAP
jgi:hypothetical protein